MGRFGKLFSGLAGRGTGNKEQTGDMKADFDGRLVQVLSASRPKSRRQR